MNNPTEPVLQRMIAEEDLPEGLMDRARQFFLMGDLSQLLELPINTEEMIEAGKVLLNAPSIRQRATSSGQSVVAASGAPCPILSESLRDRLVMLVHANHKHAEAAAYLLSHDLRARAANATRRMEEANG